MQMMEIEGKEIEELTEKISQADVVGCSPLVVIKIGLLEGIVPTQGVAHCVVLVSLNRIGN